MGVCAGSNYPFLTLKERDIETGLDYFLARYYSSTQGRFTGPDEFTGGPQEVSVLGSGHPEKQALKHAELTNPQSLNKYQYTFNNPLRYVDPDGQSPQDSYELNLERDERALLAGRISPEQFLARQNARGAGAVAGLVILAAVRGGAPIVQGLMLWATRNPDKVENLAQMLQEAGGGPPGLTLLPSSRLSSAERATGERLAQQLGVALEESAHAGEEYIVRGANKTIDAMGGPEAFQKGVMSEILASFD